MSEIERAIADLAEFAQADFGEGDLRMESIECALEALREKRERENGCEYCNGEINDFQPINGTTGYSGIEIAFHHSGMLRVRTFDKHGVCNQDVVNLTICPMCGRALKERDA